MTLSENPKEVRLIQTAADQEPQSMTQAGIDRLIRHKIHFMDVTDTVADKEFLSLSASAIASPALPKTLRMVGDVEGVIATLDTSLMEKTLKELTSFKTRYYRSKTGKQSQEYLLDTIQGLVDSPTSKANVTVRTFDHSWPQSSILARFEGSEVPEETVIVGAHQDSVNMWLPSFGRSPGADDDGSGTVTILEAFRALLKLGFRPKRSVEFHWYAAEEAGLLGSQAVSKAYRKDGRKIVGMLQNDMTGFTKGKEEIGIVTDFTDPDLTHLLESLVDQYASIPYREFTCGYGCSDHASWNKAGYRSAFHFESASLEDNPNVHTTRDEYGTINFSHALEYAKVAVGFAMELSEP
ncbi:aminopeptidase-like protein [Piptocephalis cylindrospora]|uniref:Peptide hydrolase n=1 Tax=Piptocephalis cylindrospora TaxID=1907219 RepID=A0A4P9Y2F0_9FUNG|nr:aminopeptidase-like protein [Piptocephalis cylindrospora]|eukprot:RKP12221.1 aminopeptidase-like protein [Piptocephalis cylindrospora]